MCGSRSCSNRAPALLFSERSTEKLPSTSAVDGCDEEPPTMPRKPSMPLPRKMELEFSYVLESPGTQHVSWSARHQLSVHWHVPKSFHEYTAMSRALPSDSKFSGEVSKTVLRTMV